MNNNKLDSNRVQRGSTVVNIPAINNWYDTTVNFSQSFTNVPTITFGLFTGTPNSYDYSMTNRSVNDFVLRVRSSSVIGNLHVMWIAVG